MPSGSYYGNGPESNPRAGGAAGGEVELARDPHEVIGVAKGASRDEVRRAFRRRARELHPDRNPGDPKAEERFKELVAAVEQLEGAKPGATSRTAPRGTVRRSGTSGPPAPERKRKSWLDGVLEELFGRGAAAGAAIPRGPDVRGEHTIRLAEALRGGEVGVRMRVEVPCAGCGGKVLRPPCKDCGGSGRSVDERRLRLPVPAGTRDGDEVLVEGGGAVGPGGRPGDLRVRLRIEFPPGVMQVGDDLHLELPVTVSEAVLGGRLRLNTPAGSVVLTLPPGSDGRSRLRLRGHGLPATDRSGRRGDLLIRPWVVVPSPETPGLAAWATAPTAASPADPRRELAGIFG